MSRRTIFTFVVTVVTLAFVAFNSGYGVNVLAALTPAVLAVSVFLSCLLVRD